MLRVGLRTARHRIAALLAVVCAVLGGAALLTAIGVLAESGFRSHAPLGRLAGADVVVSAEQTYHPPEDLPIALPERARVPADLAGRLARLPGVTAAVGDLSFPAAVAAGPDGKQPPGGPVSAGDPATAGHGWSSTALLDHRRVTGTAPAGAGEVALDAATAAALHASPGSRLPVTAAGHRRDYRVTAVVRAGSGSSGASGASGRGIWFADSAARRLSGHAGTVDLVAVRAAHGASDAVAGRVRHAVSRDGLRVSTGAARGDVGDLEAAAARAEVPEMAFSLTGVTVLVIAFIVGGALSVSIRTQRQDLALLRAVGATPRQIRRLVAVQASVVAAPAAAAGIGAGYLLAEQFRQLLVSIGMLPDALPLTVGPLPAAATVLLLGVGVQVAARLAARRPSRLPATEAVAESRGEPRGRSRTAVGAGLLILAAAQALGISPLLDRTETGASGTAVAGIVSVIGLALAGPSLVARVGTALARRLPARTSAPTWLAVESVRGQALRVGAAVATLAMAVVFTLTYTLTQTTVLAATRDDVRAATRAQLSIGAPALGGVPEGTADAVRRVPGVRAAAPVSATTVLWPRRVVGGDTEVESSSALVLDPAARRLLDLGVRSGSLARLTGRSVAVDAGAAKDRHVRVGDTVHLVLGDGSRATARVAATYARGLGFGQVVLSRDLAAGHLSSALADHLVVRTDGSAAAGRRVAAFAASRPGLALDTGGAAAALGGTGAVPPELWVNVAVLAVLLGYLLLGVANKLVAATGARAGELAVLRLTGATARQVRAMMRREAALVWGLSVALGAALSLLPVVLLGVGFLHRPWAAGPVWLLPAIALVVAVIAFLTSELPTRRTLAAPPVEARARAV